jgi:hypothetical protein
MHQAGHQLSDASSESSSLQKASCGYLRLASVPQNYFHCYLTSSHLDTWEAEAEGPLVRRIHLPLERRNSLVVPRNSQIVVQQGLASVYYSVLDSQGLFDNTSQKEHQEFVNQLCYCFLPPEILLLVLEEHL